MPEFRGAKLTNIGDPINDKDAVSLRVLNNRLANFSGGGSVVIFSGGTVSGDTNFIGVLSATTYYSGGTPLETIINNIAISHSGGGTSGNFVPLSGGTMTGNLFTPQINSNKILSGGTDLYSIFLTTNDGNDITRIQPGLNTYTGGTNNNPTVNISGLTIDNINVTGISSFNSISATTIFSGSSNLSSLFVTSVGLSSYTPISQFSNFTALTTSNLNHKLDLSGGTVSGDTNFTNGISANTAYFSSSTIINGGLKYTDGNQRIGRVMTSDNNGNISLATPTLAGVQIYFFQKISDPIISGYYEQLTSLPTRSVQSIINSSVTNNQILTSFITLSGNPGNIFIPGSVGNINIHALQLSGSQSSQLYFQLYKRDTGGTETLLTTTGNSGLLSGIDAEYSCDFTVTGTTLNYGDRLLTKVVSLVSGAGTPPAIQLNVEDYTASRLEVPSANVDSTNFVPYSGAMSDLNIGNHQLISSSVNSGNITGTTFYSGATSLQTIINNLSPALIISSTTINQGNTGGILFQNGVSLYEDSRNLFWDNSNKNLSIGANSFDLSNPEKIKISAGTTSSVNLMGLYSNINNYTQVLIQNTSTGSSASSDFVATADNGSQNDGYMDLGINNSNFSAGSWGNQNDGYLYISKTGTTGGNLFIGTNTGSKAIYFYTSGGTAANERMRITDTGVSANTLSASTYYSGSTPLATVINNIALANSTGATNFSNTIFVSALGSDTNGVKYNISQPFKTINKAVSAATTGDTIYVMPGIYNDIGIFKDGISYYFLNGSIIVPPTTATTPVFQFINPSNDVNIDGALLINTAANHTVMDFSANTNAVNFFVRFKQIIATNITGTDGGLYYRTPIRVGITTNCYLNMEGDIKLTSVLASSNAAAFYTVTDGVNIMYKGNIISTTTSGAISRSANTNKTSGFWNGIFSSAGAIGTVRNAGGSFGGSETYNGIISNTSSANGIHAFYQNGQYVRMTINSEIIGNIYVNNFAGSVTFNGGLNGLDTNTAGYIFINGNSTNGIFSENSQVTINGTCMSQSFVVAGGVLKVNGSVMFTSTGTYPSQSIYTQTGGYVHWNSSAYFYFNGGRQNNNKPNQLSGGKLIIGKSATFPASDVNSGGSSIVHGFVINGGTLQLEGELYYSYPTSPGTNLAAIQYLSGTLILDGGRIINFQTGGTPVSILMTGSSNCQIFNTSFTNSILSGGTLTNAITGGGSLVIYSGITQ